MRLLIFSPYFPPHVGGLEGYVRDLDAELIRLNLVEGITVLTPRIPPEGPPFEQLAPDHRVV
jgi:glycosyltransferase involved in cell wall biosynthesis